MDKRTDVINIAEILKDKPAGTKLYSIANGLVTIEKKTEYNLKHPECSTIWCNSKFSGSLLHFTYEGKSEASGECLLFPSKTMRDWKKFTWRKGDVLANQTETKIVLFDGFTTDEYTYFKGKYCYSTRLHDYINDKDSHVQLFTNHYHKINSEDAKKYIKTIEENFKGKLNMETLEIEPPKCSFKPFNKVVGRTDSGYWRIDFFEFYNIDNKYAPYQCMMNAYKECLPYNNKTAKLISTCADYK